MRKRSQFGLLVLFASLLIKIYFDSRKTGQTSENNTESSQFYTDTPLDHPNLSLKNVKDHISSHQHLFKKIATYKQEHLLESIQDLNSSDLEEFYNTLNDIDFELLNRLYNDLILNPSQNLELHQITPISNEYRFKDFSSDSQNNLRKTGLDLIAKGRASVLLLSGGQGTRLGFDHAKGMYDIGMPSRKTFFEYFADKITRISQIVQETFKLDTRPTIMWYIMASEINHQEIMDFFMKKNYFGLEPESIKFLTQQSLPAIGLDGKIIIEDKNKVHLSPNGHGGLFSSLVKQGTLKDMREKGIEYVHVFGIDNILAKPIDPLLLGFSDTNDFDITCKFISKKHPQEKVGVHVLNNGRPSVVEYSEISPEMANERDEDGVLIYDASHILNAVYKVDFLEFIGSDAVRELDKKHHVAKKKVKYYDANRGELITPSEINAYKFELFLFDVFALVKPEKFGLIEVKREEEFAPVKNAPGTMDDSPDTARELMASLHQIWFENQGVRFDQKANKEAERLFEINFRNVYDESDPNLAILANTYKEKTIKLPYFVV